MIEYTKEKEFSGILVAIDLKKAFEMLNFDFFFFNKNATQV